MSTDVNGAGSPGVRVTKEDDINAGGGTPRVTPQAAGVRQQAPNLMATLSIFGNRAMLTKEASDYIRTITEQTTETIRTILRVSTETVKSTPASSENAAIQMLTYRDCTVLLALSDSYVAPAEKPYTPIAVFLAEVAKDLASRGHHVITTKVVTPEEYADTKKLVNFLTPVFMVATMPEAYKINLRSLAGANYDIRTDISYVRSVINDWTPDSVKPVVDVGLVIRAKPLEKDGRPYDMMAIGATTKFVSKSPNGEPIFNGKDYTPIVTITAICTPTPSVSMAIFGLSLAADYLLGRQGWLGQFNRFDAKQNIGNLINDSSTGRPFRIEDPALLYEFINTRLETPWMALDIQEGAARIPGIELIVANRVAQEVADFMGVGVEEFNQPITVENLAQFTGRFKGGTDIREASFLALMAENPEGVKSFLPKLVRNIDPTFTIRSLEAIYGEGIIEPLYVSVTSLLSGQFLQRVSATMSKALNINWEVDKSVINNAGILANNGFAYSNVPLYGSTNTMTGFAMPTYAYNQYRP